jgi:ATP-dependent DNA helicase RecG
MLIVWIGGGISDAVWLRNFQDIELDDEQARALVFVREAGAITNAALLSISHIDVLTVSQHLRRLRQNDLLLQKGKGAQTYYVPTDKLLAPWQNRQKQSTGKVAGQVTAQVEKLLQTAMSADGCSRADLQAATEMKHREHSQRMA